MNCESQVDHIESRASKAEQIKAYGEHEKHSTKYLGPRQNKTRVRVPESHPKRTEPYSSSMKKTRQSKKKKKKIKKKRIKQQTPVQAPESSFLPRKGNFQ